MQHAQCTVQVWQTKSIETKNSMDCLLLRWYYDKSSCMLGIKKKMAVTLTKPLTFFCLHLSILSLKGHVPLSVCLRITSSHWTAAQAHKCMHLSVDKSLSVEMNYLAPTCYMLTVSTAQKVFAVLVKIVFFVSLKAV